MSKIEWCDKTVNCFVGCSRVSAGCDRCYAINFAWRHQSIFGAKDERYRGLVEKRDGRLEWTGKISYFRTRLADMIKGSGQRIFLNSMGDLFHPNVIEQYHDELIHLIFKMISRNGTLPLNIQNTFVILTKRPTEMVKFFGDAELPQNLWLGVTVENADNLWRVEELLKLRPYAAKLFVSVEPLLGPIDMSEMRIEAESTKWVDWLDFPPIDWVICGAETGPGKRPMELTWARDLLAQCVAAGVPFFFKKDSDGNRELDGREWNEVPS